jgi:hypothetical protein
MTNEQLLAHHYVDYRITPMLLSDIANLKKINNIYSKFLRTGKLVYMYEIINILYTLRNSINIVEAVDILLEYIEPPYKCGVRLMIIHVDILNLKFLRDNDIVHT